MSNERDAGQPPSVADLLDGDRLLTLADVATRLHVVKKTVQNWISNGTLPAVKLGRERYVLRSKLQGILERKMREAEEEAESKQREEARRREFAWLLENEPEQEWTEVACAACFKLMNASREQRLDRRIFCNLCQERGLSKSYTKEQAHRLAKVEVEERNRLAQKNLSPWDQETRHINPGLWRLIEWKRSWSVIRCGECDAPLVVKIEDILTPTFIPGCDHKPPFGDGPGSVPYDQERKRRNKVAGLAQFEANLRNHMMEEDDPVDPLWAVYPCASCDTSTASTPQKSLIGGARCRLCFGKSIKHSKRVEAIVYRLRLHHPTLTVESRACLCQQLMDSCGHDDDELCSCSLITQACQEGYTEIYGQVGAGEKELLLSWCTSRSVEARETLARTYADLIDLDNHELTWLIEDVTYSNLHHGHPDHDSSHHLDHPLVGP